MVLQAQGLIRALPVITEKPEILMVEPTQEVEEISQQSKILIRMGTDLRKTKAECPLL
jgi:hypothetical protein